MHEREEPVPRRLGGRWKQTGVVKHPFRSDILAHSFQGSLEVSRAKARSIGRTGFGESLERVEQVQCLPGG